MRFVRLFFFGNYFYGLCTVALSVEAALQQDFPLNSLAYYAAVFCAAVYYYALAYITEGTADKTNLRSVWYADNRKLVKQSQALMAVGFVLAAVIFVAQGSWRPVKIPLSNWAIFLLFPLAGALYYGLSGKGMGKYTLRRIGWLKPFAIGFTWAGLVTAYPLLFHQLQKGEAYVPTWISALLFIKNFMFITVLCIMFDIKDYAADHNLRIKTFVVINGLRRTIFFILLPLCFLGLAAYLYYGLERHFSGARILLNVIPFALLIEVAYSMHRRRSIFYYLIIIDGLMLVKALCGITAMRFL